MSGAAQRPANAEQIDYWNSAAGETWVRFQAQLDHLIAPLGAEALRQLAARPGECVIDIGCGCGDTSLDLAARVGAQGRVLGVDISRPMLDVARRRLAAEPGAAEFRQADAQCDDLGHAEFDAVFSRFGVMFFTDPVAAFANLRTALKPGGRLAFVCWRALRDNDWMREPLDAAAPYLPPASSSDPAAPGPFAFSDPVRVRSILTDAGFVSVTIDPFDARIGGGDIGESLHLALRIGPLGYQMRENPQLMPSVAGAVRAALERYATPQGVMMPAGVWIVRAQN